MSTNPASARLPREFQRLYAVAAGAVPDLVRGLVLEVAQPAQWQPMAAVWQGVQADLDLPAPGIAVNGVDGLQLWFSLLEPVPAAQGLAFLDRLRQRYMAALPPGRVRARAEANCTLPPTPPDGPWPAFVAADLAPLFEDTPWLDVRPGDEGQADLLSRLASIKPAAWAAAVQRLQPPKGPAPDLPQTAPVAPAGPAHPQALQFLLAVMTDATAPLAVRVEAAKALLPYGAGSAPG